MKLHSEIYQPFLAFEDDSALMDKKGFRTTLALVANSNANPTATSKSSGVIQTPWGRIDKG